MNLKSSAETVNICQLLSIPGGKFQASTGPPPCLRDLPVAAHDTRHPQLTKRALGGDLAQRPKRLPGKCEIVSSIPGTKTTNK